MTLSNIAASAGKRAARYGYRNHRPLVPLYGSPRHNELNGIHSNPKMNGERTVIGPRGVPPISICVKGPFALVWYAAIIFYLICALERRHEMHVI
jgi:hypothetical protein